MHIMHTGSTLENLLEDLNQERKVEWKYLEMLFKYQQEGSIHLNNKITRHHVNFRSKIMNVRICAQTMHENTADSLLQCEFDLKLRDFKNSIFTAIFFKVFHRIFKIFNSSNDAGDEWSKPVTKDNCAKILHFLSSAEKFVRCLKLPDGKSVVTSKVHTGFVGVLVAIDVLRHLSASFISSQLWKSIMLYNVSQDLIEMFFGFIRLRLGCNDNPDAYMLQCVYKSILEQMSLVVSRSRNCYSINTTEHVFLTHKATRLKVKNIEFDVDKSWLLSNIIGKKTQGRPRLVKQKHYISIDDSIGKFLERCNQILRNQSSTKNYGGDRL